VGDELASRAESDPGAEIEWQAVEECFRRTGRVLHLHFTDGELIRTTPEHPFWVRGEGWVPAGALKAGDKLSTLSGEWVALREAFDTEQWEPVYNVRVANTHTYFVGDENWAFALWAHNTYTGLVNALNVIFNNDFSSRGLKAKETWKVANSQNTHAGWVEFQAKLKSAELSKEQLRDLWWVARATADITAQQARAVFTQTQSQAVQILTPIVQQIQQILQGVGINDVSFGIRGSLATGWSYDKSLQQDGRPWDPSHFDVDAFVKSTTLVGLIPGTPTPSGGTFTSLANIDRAVGFRSGEANHAAGQSVKALILQAQNELAAAFTGRLKNGEFAFKVFRSTVDVPGLSL